MSRHHRAATSRHASAHHTAADNESESSHELERMSRKLKRYGLGVRDVRRDGNCFFRAVSDQLYGTEEHHAYLRDLCCEYMEAHEDDLAPFLDDSEQSFSDYIDHMRTPGVWAGNIEIHAMSKVCHRDIRIHQHGKPSYDLRNHGRGTKSIHLFYHYGEHYASVRPLHQMDDQDAADHDPLPSGSLSSSSSSRRARRTPPEDVTEIWERLDHLHCELLQKVEHAEAAARFFRRAATSDLAETAADMADDLDEEVRVTSDDLTHLQDRVDYWKRSHAERAEFRENHSGELDSDSDSGSDSSYASASDGYGFENDSTNHAYARAVRKEKKYLTGLLERADERISEALHRAARLRETHVDGSKKRHPSKKREQDERRKQRKARRRREQERQARRQSDHNGYTIGMWSVQPEVSI